MKNKIKSILVVAPDFPYPPTYGGAADIWGRIIILRSMNLSVHLMCSSKNEPHDKDIEFVRNHVSSLTLVNRKNKVLDLFDKRPLQIVSRQKLASYNFRTPYDLVLLESEYVGAILENKTLKYKHSAIRVHNNEAAYFNSLYKSSAGLSKFYYAIESFKFKKYKNYVDASIKNYLFISKDEFSSYTNGEATSNKLMYHLPPPIAKVENKRALTSKNILFIGSLFMPNNIEALRWYLDNVHAGLKDILGYKLIIAGSTKGKNNSYLDELATSDPNVVYCPDVANLNEIYDIGSIFINPMRHGAGVKMKSIHAMQEGLPVVSTSVGMEGTGLLPDIHFKLADTPEEFTMAIRQLLSDETGRRNMVESSQTFLMKHFNHEAILSDFLQKLEQ